ncbi:MAG: hypothetical protein U5J64_01910 [Halobacteriales archaeon]|nr:hypothetical protein [Halobacteriales archaeon]
MKDNPAVWTLFVGLQIAAVAVYFLVTDTVALTAHHALIPVVWVTLGAWAVVNTPLPDELPSYAPLVAVVSGVYLLILLYLGGMVGTTTSPGSSFFVSSASPGWGPIFGYTAEVFYLRVVPFQFVGYVVLAYLVFVALTDTATSLVGAAVGMVSCVGCTWPIIAGILSVVGAGGVGATSAVQSLSYELSTVVFAVAVLVLYRYASPSAPSASTS